MATFYCPQQSWGKVKVSQASVILSIGGEGDLFPRGCLVETPGWLLLQMVCILLECILVFALFFNRIQQNDRQDGS